MEEYLIFFAIGGLILLTLLVNSVSEAYEQKQREKRIKILKIKQGLEEISYLLERLKGIDISNAIRDLLLNEIMARLQAIQRLDRNFRGIQTLIDEAKEEAEQVVTPLEKAGLNIKDETEFKKKMVLFRQLLKWLSANQWYSRVKPTQLKTFSEDVKLLRCEKIFQYYAEKARLETEQNNYLVAKEHYHYILHALKQSGVSSNPRIMELLEQTEFMMDQVSQMISSKIRKIVNEEIPGELTDKDEQAQPQEQNSSAETKNSTQDPEAATSSPAQEQTSAQPSPDTK